jgi:hypothetical protein
LETPLRVTARTCAQSAYGEPVIHGRRTGIAAVGIFKEVLVQICALSAKLLLVESSNSYRTAPRTGFQANDGVREKVRVGASSARNRNGFRPVGAAMPAFAAGANTSIAKKTAARRTADMATRVVGGF